MISPMMQHYLQTKENYKECVLFYRLGDFYEFFYDDAVQMSKVLDLTLTGKDCGLEERAPMCGIPYHAAENYINKLISLGYKVAICEQLTEPKKGVKVVERDVVRVITAGTIIDEGMLEDKKNNYLACIFENEETIGVSFCDCSTGEFAVSEFYGDSKLKQLNDILVRIMPSEILCNSSTNIEKILPICTLSLAPKFYNYDANQFRYEIANKTLCQQFGDNFKQVFELTKLKTSICCAGALFSYIKDTQKRALSHINSIKKVNNDKYMVIDINTRRNLEILETIKDRRKKGSLIGVMDKTKTSMGARLFRSWIEQPLCNSKEINERLDSVEEFYSKIMLRDALTSKFNRINDIERISGRIAYGNFNPRDCLALKNSLELLPSIKNELKVCKCNHITNLVNAIDDYSNIVDLLNTAISDNPPAIISGGGFIKNGYNAQLDEYHNAMTDGQKWLIELEQKERENTGIKNLKIGFNKVFGFYIEINKSALMNVPLNYQRKQTVANNERFITEDLKILEEKILGAEESSIKLEQKIFAEIREKLLSYIPSFQNTATAIAELDCLLSLADIAIKNNYVKPKILSKSLDINIVSGRHPVVEDIISSGEFIANDTYLNDTTDKIMIITGPNMAGKSTFMRQVAVITLMAHIGSFVPAKSAEICLTDRIFTRVGASDDLSFGQSTFMVEMTEVAQILQNATDHSLIVLDEIGRGTSTFDGLSIAWAVVEYLVKNLKAKTLFATHYHELTELENILAGVKNYKISIKEINGNIVFLRKIVRGGANKSFGIEVASLAGVPKDVISRAKQISVKLEQTDINKNILNDVDLDKTLQNKNTLVSSEIMAILKDLDINKISPIVAFETLSDLINRAQK